MQLIKDYHLVLLVLGFVMVDTITLVVITSLDNSRFTVITIPNKQDPTPRINVRMYMHMGGGCIAYTSQILLQCIGSPTMIKWTIRCDIPQ